MIEPAQIVAAVENPSRWAVKKKKTRMDAIFVLFAHVVAQKANGKKFNKTGGMSMVLGILMAMGFVVILAIIEG